MTLKGEYYVYEEKNEVKERKRHDGKDEKGVKGFIKMMKPTVGYTNLGIEIFSWVASCLDHKKYLKQNIYFKENSWAHITIMCSIHSNLLQQTKYYGDT